jgi:hypothetical protein
MAVHDQTSTMNFTGAAIPPNDEQELFILPSQSFSSSEEEEEEQEMQRLPMTQNMDSVIRKLLNIVYRTFLLQIF